MKKFGYIIGLILLFSAVSHAQDVQDIKGHVAAAKIIDGDTVPYYNLSEIHIVAPKFLDAERNKKQWEKLVRNVKKVYPYAKAAGFKLKQYNDALAKMPTEKERKAFLKKAEKEIKEQFGKELEKLTFTQGKILIKLIDRETGNTSYSLVKELRGSFTAFIYQAFARLFGYNLKAKYDPEGEDKPIEVVVKLIEAGQI